MFICGRVSSNSDKYFRLLYLIIYNQKVFGSSVLEDLLPSYCQTIYSKVLLYTVRFPSSRISYVIRHAQLIYIDVTFEKNTL